MYKNDRVTRRYSEPFKLKILAAQSDVDETLSWLEKSQEKRENTFAYMVNVDPIFKPILENPRFVEMRRKMQYYDKESSY